LKVRHCIATGNGTDSLFLCLKALGITAGDEVITPAFSWISSAEVITMCGASPVFADIDATYTIDPAEVSKKITPKTKAVVAVHLYGQMCHMKELTALCKKHKLFLVEDCAQAHLSNEGGRYAGTFSDAAAFSFYPTKNLGAYGDAGCVVTANEVLAERIRRLSNHGALVKDDHTMEGMNSRMDTLQAAVLLSKLPHLARWNDQRRQYASQYQSRLVAMPDIVAPHERPNTCHTFHLFAIRAKRRDALKSFLEEKGIQTLIHYPRALTNLPPYKNQSCRFPVAEQIEAEILSLPLYPELSTESVDYVCDQVIAFYKK
jgi:dTDP-4-amino-4,6-dideoxygalactose transaminase